MPESIIQKFNHLKLHTQYSICEGAIKIDDLKNSIKENKIRSIALCDTSNLCGALEFAEKISKTGVQPIIGTQINFKFGDTIGLLPLFALNEKGYKRIIELSSSSYLHNDEISHYVTVEDDKLKVHVNAAECGEAFAGDSLCVTAVYCGDLDYTVQADEHTGAEIGSGIDAPQPTQPGTVQYNSGGGSAVFVASLGDSDASNPVQPKITEPAEESE